LTHFPAWQSGGWWTIKEPHRNAPDLGWGAAKLQRIGAQVARVGPCPEQWPIYACRSRRTIGQSVRLLARRRPAVRQHNPETSTGRSTTDVSITDRRLTADGPGPVGGRDVQQGVWLAWAAPSVARSQLHACPGSRKCLISSVLIHAAGGELKRNSVCSIASDPTGGTCVL
jgi:hypothetical protein